MRNLIFAVMVLALLIAGGCKKNNNAGGSWTFQGSAHGASSCTGSAGGVLTASDLNNDNPYTYSTIECSFYQTLPAQSGTYIIVPFPAKAANQLALSVTVDASVYTYNSTLDSAAKTVSVTVNNGYVSVKGSGLELLNKDNGGDSSSLSINLTQTTYF